jgi:transposase
MQIALGPEGVLKLEQHLGSAIFEASIPYSQGCRERTSMDTSDMTSAQSWVGIDVSKDKLDACLLRLSGKPLPQVFKNDPNGHKKLLRWALYNAPGAKLHFCMESTGSYSQGIALFLAEAEHLVSVVNPHPVKHYAIAQGICNKTDPVDAHTIADFCRTQSPPQWRMCAPEVRTLVSLVRRQSILQEHLQQERNRLSEPGLIKEVQQSIKATIRFLETQISKVNKQIEQHIDSHPKLKQDKELLESIPGIGDITALWILAELPDVKQFASADAAAAYAGVNPREYSSGKSVRKRTRISKRGNARLRRALYMPALIAAKYNPCCSKLYDRLLARGMAKKAAICAVMRKLLMIAFGVLKSQTKFITPAVESAA